MDCRSTAQVTMLNERFINGLQPTVPFVDVGIEGPMRTDYIWLSDSASIMGRRRRRKHIKRIDVHDVEFVHISLQRRGQSRGKFVKPRRTDREKLCVNLTTIGS